MSQSISPPNDELQGAATLAATRDRYVNLVLERHSRAVDVLSIVASSAFHLGFLVVDHSDAPPSVRMPLLYAHAAFLTFGLLWLGLERLRRRQPDFRAVIQVMNVVVMAVYVQVIDQLTVEREMLLLRFALTGLIAALFLILANPARRLALRLPSDIVCCGMVAVALRRHPDGVALALLTVGMGLFCVMLRHFHWESVRRKAQQDFERQSKLAPPHIVLKAVATSQPVEELFAPSSRLCCCISSDWRNYTALTAQSTPEEMAKVLGRYYDAILSALRTIAPSEKYFCDWIADELFIVMFGDDPEEERQLVNQALLFACRLVQIKERFRKEVGIPDAIDVGVACGSAFTGIMGPQANRKATSIGDVPCRARRLQNGGKLLRDRLGETDRVVFGRDSLMRISASYPVAEYALRAGEKVRDLDDQTLFYIEPDKAGLDLSTDEGLIPTWRGAS